MQGPPNPADAPRPGRRLVISGIVVMVFAVLGVGVANAILGGSIRFDKYERDIVFNGPADSGIPGRIHFKVIEDISPDADDDMSVGIAASTGAGVECRIDDAHGAEVDQRAGSIDDSFVSGMIESDWKPIVIAPRLAPGEYSAECSERGEPSAQGKTGDGSAARFTAGRVVTLDEMLDTAKPVFAVLGAVAVGGLVGLVGLTLLIVGLVIGHRSRRNPPLPAGPPPRPGP